MKILLIEDNDEIRENTAELLTLANYHVISAENGRKGVELAVQQLPDLILCDIMMPELDGYGVLHILSRNSHTNGIPFIFLTAMTETRDLRKGMNLGADDYLMKPFDETELLNSIEIRLRKSKIKTAHYENSEAGLNVFLKDAGTVLKIDDLRENGEKKLVTKKGQIFSEGDNPLGIFFITMGSVKTYRTHSDGKDFITSLHKTGDFFGYESLLAGSPHQESAMAMEDSEVVIIPKNDFLLLIGASPEIAAGFISLLSNNVIEKQNQLLSLAYNSLRQRTAESLLKLKSVNPEVNFITASREDLARMVGTASESVIRILSDFKDESILEIINGKIRILQLDKLEQVIRWNVSR